MTEVYDPERHGPLLTPEAASAYLLETHAIPLNETRLSELRAFAGGPRFIKPTQKSVRYPRRLLDEWANARNAKPILDAVPHKPHKPPTAADLARIVERQARKRAEYAGAKRAASTPGTRSPGAAP